MLTNVTIEGYRCFPELNVSLKPLTVLVGENDTGKSAFLRAVQLLAMETRLKIPTDSWKLEAKRTIEVRGRTSTGEVQVRSDQAGRVRPPGADAALEPAVLYQLPSGGVQLRCRGYPDHQKPPPLGEAGENIAALLDYLLRRDRISFDRYVSDVKNYIPGLSDIQLGTPGESDREVELATEGGWVVRQDQMSVGVRLMLFFVALGYHPSPPRLILLEEPENGVHPRRQAEIVRLLRDLTTGVNGKQPAQVILSTHSPYLLDSINLEKDQVLVFRRQEDGSRTAEPVDVERLKAFLDEFMLGEVWYNEGEEGLVKKQP